MNIGEFTGLDREAQFAKAAEIASESGVRVDPSTFDGVWRTESGRGANMLSPAGAKGHFGLMDTTRATWEQRFGTSIDPMNFGQSLFTAAHTMKENLGKFKNVPDALRAYNGGWDPAKWGNAETSAYAGKVLGGDDSPMNAHNTATAQATSPVTLPAASYWDKPFNAAEKGPKAVKTPIAKTLEDLQQISEVGGLTPPQAPTFGSFDVLAQQTGAADIKKTQLAKDTSMLDTARAAAFNTLPVRALMYLNRDPEPIDPNFQVKEEQLKGYVLSEQKDLLAAGSQVAYDRIKREIDYGKEQDEIVGRNGLLYGLAAGFIAGGPEAVLTGGAGTLALGRTAYGSVALAARGAGIAARGASFVEGAIGNLVNTAALDMLGDRQGVNAYALSAGMGILNPILQGRYIGDTVSKVHETQGAQRMVLEAARKEEVLMGQAKANLEKTDPGIEHGWEDIKAEMDRLDVKGQRADIASHRNAIPETRKMNVGDEEAVAEAAGKKVSNPEDVAAGATPVPEPAKPSAEMQAATADAPVSKGNVLVFDEDGQTTFTLKDGRKVLIDKGEQHGQVALTVHSEGKQVGEMLYSPHRNDGLNEGKFFHPDTFIDEGFQRNGIGTALYDFAESDGLRLVQNKDYKNGELRSDAARALYDSRARRAAASADGELGGAAGKAGPQDKWDSPAFQEARIERIKNDPDWNRDFSELTGGQDLRMAQTLPPGVHVTQDMQAAMAGNPTLANTVKAVMEVAGEYMPEGHRIVLHSSLTKKGIKDDARGMVISAGDTHAIGLNVDRLKVEGRNQLTHTAMHEVGHAIFHAWAPMVPKETLAAIANEWEAFVKKVDAGDVAGSRADRLAVTHPSRFDTKPVGKNSYALRKDEMTAEQFVSHLQNRLISGAHGKLSTSTINSIIDGVKAALNYIKDLVGLGKVKPGKAHDEMFHAILNKEYAAKAKGEEFLAPDLRIPELAAMDTDIPPKLAKEVNELINDPVAMKHGLDRLPMGTPTERAEAKQILSLYKKAESPEYAVDEKRLSTLLNQVDALNPTSNIMLRSKNPVVRMAAIELLENGGGAAGRRSTASIAKHMNERAIVGDSIVALNREFDTWFKAQPGASNMKEAFTGRQRAQFSRLVAEEIEQRRFPGQQSDLGQNVRNAADSVEASFERARLMQVDAKTAGWAALPETSKGYLPHRIKSNTYRNLTVEQKRALHAELTDQFVTVSEFDPTFADQLASRYLDRTEQRALGGFDAPMGMHQTGATDLIKESLEQMGLNRQEVDQMMKRHVAGAAAHTKKRLNIDLRKTITSEDGSTFTLMDLYDTDALSLIRGQSQRVAGEVALARHGVMGKPGLAVMRRAMGYGGTGEQAVAKEVEAFDQISAEFLGQPFGKTNKWVDRAVQFNSVSSLGGMGFNQLGEQINVAATLGVKTAAKIVPEFGRIRAEVAALARGEKVDNPVLGSLETMGGSEFGTDAYKMVFPMDNPDLFNNSMGADSVTGADRLLRGGGHLQTKLSGWKLIHSTQTRFVAEQIVLKAAKAMKQGVNDFHMRDMGVTDEVFEALRKDIDKIAVMKDGKIVSFDITKATDTSAANDFIQAVHRGGSQIIQGTFIGENGKYVHDSYLRLLTQFRSFSLTAIDKQWNRQVGNRGVGGAVIVTLAAMSAAAPLYLARTYAASIGRKDQAEYLEKHTSFGAIAKATTNYIATAGLAGDFIDGVTAVTGTSEWTGGRSGTATTATGLVPTLGKVDKLWGAVQNTKDGTDAHALIKELPMARLPFLIPAINALDH